jgi:hypothetical protein
LIIICKGRSTRREFKIQKTSAVAK